MLINLRKEPIQAMTVSRYYALVMLLLCGLKLKAQTRSFDSWYSVQTDYEVFKNFEVGSELGLRLEDGYSDVNYIDTKLSYQFLDFFSIKLTHRYAGTENIFDVGRIDNRFTTDFNFKYDLGDFRLGFRYRHQTRFKDWFSSEDGTIPDIRHRFKTEVKYKINKKIDVELGTEFNIQAAYDEPSYFHRYRLYSGVGYDINDFHGIGISYIFQREIQTSNPHTANIISIAYSFDLTKYVEYLKFSKERAPEQKINWYRESGEWIKSSN